MQHQKSTHPSPSPPTKNQNPCLTNKIRTTKKPLIFIYIYTYIYIYTSSLCPEESTSSCRPFRMVQALRAAKKDLPPPTPTASPPETMPPEVAASAAASSSAASGAPKPKPARTPGVSGGRWEFRWCRVVLGEVFGKFLGKWIHIKHLFLEKKHHLLQFLCLWGEGIC